MLACPITKIAHTFDHKEAAEYGFCRFLYRRLHIPSGNVSEDSLYCNDLNTFRILMAAWNRLGDVIWKYWEI